jgi:hypothetical protein
MSSSFANVSLYIPHVFANISKKTVADTFDSLRIGAVKRVDFVYKKNAGGDYNAAYIHFNYWYDNIAARNFQERVLDVNREARIVYDEPWYWIVLENKGAKADLTKRKPRVDIEALSKTQHLAPVEKMMTNEDFANLFKNQEVESSYNQDLEQSSYNQDLESDEDFNEFVRLMTMSKETYYAQEDAAIITQDDLVRENRKLREQLGEYMGKVGRLEHEYNMLMDEKLCVSNELAWLKEQQVYNNV